MRVRVLLAACAALVPLVASLPASAFQVFFDATDLDDALGPGGDLWEYTYRARGFAFAADQGFSVEFDPALHAALGDPPPAVGPDWDLVVLQPDAGLGRAGLYDAVAQTDGASVAQPFAVRFVWLGAPGTQPGAQPWSLNQFDAQGNLLDVLATGITVPEAPWQAALAGIALGALCAARTGPKRRRLPRV